MATTTNSGLLPPLVDSIAPAKTGDSIRIYYQLSEYNSIKSIKQVHILLKLSSNNKTAFNSNTYPMEIKTITLNEKNNYCYDDSEGKYYVLLEKDDLANGWQSNIYLKMQLRFSSVEQDSPLDATSLQTGINDNYYSEWSEVCLVRHLNSISVSALNGFYSGESPWLGIDNDPLHLTCVSAKLNFSEGESDYLNTYRVKLYECDYESDSSTWTEKTLLEDSGTIDADISGGNVNLMSYRIKLSYQIGFSYCIIIDYITAALYTGQARFLFTVAKDYETWSDATLSTYSDEEKGCIILFMKFPTSYSGDIVVKRSSSRDGYATEDDLITLTPSTTDITKGNTFGWADYSVESGVFYRYRLMSDNDTIAKLTDSDGNELTTMVLFDNAYLLTKTQQLKLKYDTKVSSLKETLLESVTNTIGGKYPFVRQNGNVRYKQFSLSGLISKIADEDGLFGTESEILGTQWQNEYEAYRDKHRILSQNDLVLERELREKVLQFLTNGKPKLFKSLTEGNYLVVLQGVSLSPNETLGRLIWTFSATAYEVAEVNVENLQNYDIIMTEAYIAENAQEPVSHSSLFYHEFKTETVKDSDGNIVKDTDGNEVTVQVDNDTLTKDFNDSYVVANE